MILQTISLAFWTALVLIGPGSIDSIKVDSALGIQAVPEVKLTEKMVIEPVAPDSGSVEISVGVVELSVLNDSATVDILCDLHGRALGGMDLMVGTNSQLIDIVGVERGGMQEDNHWSMFSATESNQFGEAKVWHIVSLARAMSGGTSQPRLSWAGAAVIAKLIVRVKEPQRYSDTLHAIQFYWNRCSDNTLSDSTGTNLMVGQVGWNAIAASSNSNLNPATYGSMAGPAVDCFSRSPRPPANIISFNGGGLVLRSDFASPDPPDSSASPDTTKPASIDDLR